jgi:hypothetical protein
MTSDHKIEGKLRILRSYRIKLAHIYCRDVLREVYQESIKIQLLRIWNDLRWKSFLLPFSKKKELLLYCGQWDYKENLPYLMAKNNWIFQDQHYNIDNYNNGRFKTFYYIPHSMEICYLDNKISSDLKIECQYPTGIAEQIDESDLEEIIREKMVATPTITLKTNVWLPSFSKPILGTNLKEAYNYGGNTFDLLLYLTLVNHLFSLHYWVAKLNVSGHEALSSTHFWGNKQLELGAESEEDENRDMPSILIKKIVEEKRQKSHLIEDLKELKNSMGVVSEFIRTAEDKNLNKVTSVLLNLHYLMYYYVLHGMEKVNEVYWNKSDTKNFRIMQDSLRHFQGEISLIDRNS